MIYRFPFEYVYITNTYVYICWMYMFFITCFHDYVFLGPMPWHGRLGHLLQCYPIQVPFCVLAVPFRIYHLGFPLSTWESNRGWLRAWVPARRLETSRKLLASDSLALAIAAIGAVTNRSAGH